LPSALLAGLIGPLPVPGRITTSSIATRNTDQHHAFAHRFDLAAEVGT
jgi:hypothetical protein